MSQTSRKHVREMHTPLNPTFIYSKTGVCTGIPIFLIFAPKHRLWVLVARVPTIYVLSKNKKNIKHFLNEIFPFLHFKKSLYIAWASFRNVLPETITDNHFFIAHKFLNAVCVLA